MQTFKDVAKMYISLEEFLNDSMNTVNTKLYALDNILLSLEEDKTIINIYKQSREYNAVAVSLGCEEVTLSGLNEEELLKLSTESIKDTVIKIINYLIQLVKTAIRKLKEYYNTIVRLVVRSNRQANTDTKHIIKSISLAKQESTENPLTPVIDYVKDPSVSNIILPNLLGLVVMFYSDSDILDKITTANKVMLKDAPFTPEASGDIRYNFMNSSVKRKSTELAQVLEGNFTISSNFYVIGFNGDHLLLIEESNDLSKYTYHKRKIKYKIANGVYVFKDLLGREYKHSGAIDILTITEDSYTAYNKTLKDNIDNLDTYYKLVEKTYAESTKLLEASRKDTKNKNNRERSYLETLQASIHINSLATADIVAGITRVNRAITTYLAVSKKALSK